MQTIKYIDLFAGMGGIRLGLEQALNELGMQGECVMTSEIKPHAIQVYTDNFKDSNIQGDISKIDARDIPDFDMLLAGFPCFTGEMLVLTKEGYKQIKDIKIGDIVLSHDNKYHKVTNAMCNGKKEIVNISGVAFDEIRTTLNHKFYVRKRTAKKNSCGKYEITFGEPTWMSVKELIQNDDKGVPLYKSYWFGSAINNQEITPKWSGIETYINHCTKRNICNLDINDENLWYIVGLYLGDGWIKKNGKKGKNRNKYSGIIISCNKNKTNEIAKKISETFNCTISYEKTANKIHISNVEFAHFCEQFGKYANGKKIPGFVFDMPTNLIQRLIDGYIDSDGHTEDRCITASSVSKELIYGLSYCIQKAYGIVCSVIKINTPKTTMIEGRVVNQKDCYMLQFLKTRLREGQSIVEDGYAWYRINDIEISSEIEPVYDITVEDAHSFIVQNCIVHNCQSFSSSGKRLGFNDTRGTLFFEVARILKEKQPQFFLLENVDNLVIHDMSPEDKKNGATTGRTLNTVLSVLEELNYHVSWKVLAASDFGVPQIRKRIYIVGSKKGCISLDNFNKIHRNFGDIQEHNVPTEDTDFTLKIKQYLRENKLPLSYLYDKSIRDKRGGDNNLHSWNLELRGKTNQYQRELMEKLLLERRNKERAKEKGVPTKDGVGLSKKRIEENLYRE